MRSLRPLILPTQPATRAVLLSAGFTRAMIETRLRSGQLVRLRSGVYVAASAVPSEASGQHLLQGHAEQARYPTAVLSHETAAIVWTLPTPGVQPWHESPVAVTLPRGGDQKSRARSTTHHLGPLPAHHVVRDPDGYPVTSIARTAVELAADLSLPEQLVLLDAAARRLCESFLPAPRRRDHANPKLIAETQRMFLDAVTVLRLTRLRAGILLSTPQRESVAESLSAGHFHLAGIPAPLFNPPITTFRGTLYPDCCWPDQHLIGECDGAVKYRDPSAYENEKDREQVFRDEGYRVVRWSAKEAMFSPGVMVARVGRKLGV